MATTENTAPAEAPSLSSIVVQAQALAATVEKLQADIRAALDRESPAAPAVERGHPNDRTGNRMRAYVASVRQLRGVNYNDDIDEANQRGRSLIERLALSADGTDLPELRLGAGQVADVLSFMASVEPVEPEGWWNDPKDAPSHLVGFYLILQSLEESLRKQPVTVAEAPAESYAEAPTAASRSAGGSCAFCDLQSRLMAILAQVQCADRVLYNLQDVPEDLHPACITLHAAAEALDRFYNDLDGWDTHRAYAARQEAREAVTDTRPTAEAAEPVGTEAIAKPDLPEALVAHLQEQQTRVAELLSLLERLDEDADQMYTRIAVREARELEKALDSMTLSKVMAGESP